MIKKTGIGLLCLIIMLQGISLIMCWKEIGYLKNASERQKEVLLKQTAIMSTNTAVVQAVVAEQKRLRQVQATQQGEKKLILKEMNQ
ncbi:hypothetical protein SDC9_184436 [bioreactor metagenome]|uniref:Uncharacterized protein n=1 Tax=bioreactor metagenome TaxID=1076179 RepID=A0A645HLG6_9ZZZZ